MTSPDSPNPDAEHQFIVPKISKARAQTIQLPGSKSIALRQLAISALIEGTSTLTGIPVCDDIEAMLDCLARLGAQIATVQQGHELKVTVQGPINFTDDVTLNARMSGASTRLLLGLASLRQGMTEIDGHPSLRVRTNRPLLDALEAHGCSIESQSGGLPVKLQGPLKAHQRILVDGSISSQYITALMIIAPALLSQRATTPQIIEISGELVSRPYIEITLAEMHKRGAQAAWRSSTELTITNQPYTPDTIAVEGDATAASYFLAMATLHGSEISFNNLGHDTHQGDLAFAGVMQQLGAELRTQGTTLTIKGPQVLSTLADVDMQSMPDAALTLIAMAPLIPGDTLITGLSTLHHKECDRLECSAQALVEMGIAVKTTHDSIMVPYCAPEQISSHVLNTHHDHRMAMAFSTLGSITGQLTIDDKAVVDKTYPHYWQDYQSLVG